MAVNSYDPTDGHPIFSDADAPDIKVDPGAVAEYAAEVGTRLIKNTADRVGYAFAREGLRCYDTDLDIEFLHTGSGWKAWESGWKAYTPASTTINEGSGGTKLTQYRYSGGRVFVEVRWTFASGGTITGTAKVALPVPRKALSADFEESPEIGRYYQSSITRSHWIKVTADGVSTTVVRFAYGDPYATGDVTSTNPANPIVIADTIHAVFSYDPA